jgi:hypothetical protein
MPVPVRGPSVRAVALAVSAVAVLAIGLRATSAVDDAFDGTRLARSRWADISQGGAVSVNGELAMTTSDSASFSRAAVLTQYRLLGDFDIQVNYRIGDGWNAPIDPALSGAHIEIPLAVYEDDSRLVQIARAKDSGGEGFRGYNTYPGQETHNSVWVPSSAVSGALRIMRTGSVVTLRYFADSSWHDLDVITTSAAPVRVLLAAGNVGVAQHFGAYFDDFTVNSGATSYRAYTRPSSYLLRSDVMLGGASTDYLALRTWNTTDWKGIHPLDTLMRWGMRWLRVGTLTTSSSYLRDTPPERWSTLPWRNEYWGCREYAAQMMREASDRGMRLNGYLWLSDKPAHAGIQHTPPEWAGLIAELRTAVSQLW